MPRFYPDSIFHFSENKHVAELEKTMSPGVLRDRLSGENWNPVLFGPRGAGSGLYGFLRDQRMFFLGTNECCAA